MDLEMVYAEYCKPKLEACSCSKMLDNRLSNYSNLTKIKGMFAARKLKACNCFLGAAARSDFRIFSFKTQSKDPLEQTNLT